MQDTARLPGGLDSRADSRGRRTGAGVALPVFVIPGPKR